jgi:beta-lactamase class A
VRDPGSGGSGPGRTGRPEPAASGPIPVRASGMAALLLFLALLPPGIGAQDVGGGPAIPGEPALREGFRDLRPVLENRIAQHRGVVGVVVLDSHSGELLSIRGDEPFPSASVIKVPVLFEIMYRAQEGAWDLDDPLSMLELDRTPGAGILQHLSTPFPLTVRDAALLMTALSDNTATNLLLEKLGPRSVGERMAALGMPETRVFRKVFGNPADSFDPAGSERWGFGVTTPLDQARLLAWIHRGDAVNPDASREMLRMLRAQFYREGIPRHLPPAVEVAHKTGSISAARHDCGIVFGPEREYVICAMTRENEDTRYTADNEAEALIAELSVRVFRGLNPG